MIRGQLAHPLALGIGQARALRERLIDLQETIVGRVVLLIEDHFDRAEPLY